MRDFRSCFARFRRPAALVALLASASVATWATTKGPDAAGYSGTDSVVYSFVDISGASGGTSTLADTDDGTAALALPFTFQFYGHAFTFVCVSTNGAIYFVPNAAACSGVNDFANTDLASTSTPNDLPAAFPLWSDLTFQVPGAGAVFYQTLGGAGARRFVVQWNNAFPQGSPNPVTFQAILSEGANGLLFQYKAVGLGPGNPASNGAQATVGIRDGGAPANERHVAWSFGAPVLGDNTALQFSVPVVGTNCPKSHGYWKNHSNSWPVVSLSLGGKTYAKAELLTILKTPVGSGGGADASLILAYQLIAAKLNVAGGSDSAPANAAIGTADTLLSGFDGKLPYKVRPSSAIGRQMTAAASALEAYNTQLTPGCKP